MSVDERHRRLYRKLEAVLGSEEAETLIDDLATRVVTPELLRQELQALEARFDLKLEVLESRIEAKLSALQGDQSAMEARLLDKLNDQTKTMFRTVVVTNATMVFAVAGLAFGAARLG